MFIIYAAIGIIAVKSGVLNRKTLNVVSRIVMKIAMPLMIATNTINGSTKEDFIQAWPLMLATVIYYLILFLTGWLLRKLFRLSGNRGRVYQACAMFSNIGFMGIPVVMALFPGKGILYITLFTVVDQLVLWTAGVNLTLPVDGEVRYTTKEKLLKMINPCTVGILLAVLFVFAEIPIPEVINTALTRTGAVATPLAMIYLGGIFCFVNIPDCLRKKEIYGTVVIKMIGVPVLLFALFSRLSWLSHDMAVTLSMLAAMPTMSTIAMLAQSQKSAGDYAVGIVFVTTLLSAVTLPLVCLLIG